MMRGIQNDSGFTLVELVIVVSIIALTALISAPAISEWAPYYRLKGDANTIAGMLTSARFEAVGRGQDVDVVFDTVNEVITVSLSSDGTVIDTYTLSPSVNFGFDSFVKDTSGGSVPESAVTFASNQVSFSSNGAATPTGEIYLNLDPNEVLNEQKDFAVDVSAAGNVRYLRWNKSGETWE